MAERETKLLMQEYRQRKTPTMFLYDMFWNNKRVFNQTNVQVDIVSATRRMADYNVRGNVSNRVTKKGFLSYTYEPPVMNDSVTLTHQTCASATAGEDIYSPLSPQARMIRHMADAAAEMSEAQKRRIEYQCYEALFVGSVSVPSEVSGGTIEFPVDSELLDISPSASWDTASTKILKDLKSASLSVLKMGGVMPDVLVLGADALSAFLSNTQVLSVLDNRRYEGSNIMSRELFDEASYIGRIDAEGVSLAIYSYNGMYDVDGTDTPYIPAKKALLIKAGARRDACYAAIESNNAPDGIAAVEQFVDTWEEKDPDGWKVRVQTAPIMIPTSIDTWATIQCIPA